MNRILLFYIREAFILTTMIMSSCKSSWGLHLKNLTCYYLIYSTCFHFVNTVYKSLSIKFFLIDSIKLFLGAIGICYWLGYISKVLSTTTLLTEINNGISQARIAKTFQPRILEERTCDHSWLEFTSVCKDTLFLENSQGL